MLPFIELTSISLGPLSIQPFGVLVATGVLVGTSIAAKYAVEHRCSEDALRYIGMRVVVVGVLMAHLLDVFLYTPHEVVNDPLLILRFWQGISSYGGILGGVLAFTIWAKKTNAHYLRYGDAVVYGFVPGFTFGRMGCSTAHDHLGAQTDFFLGVHLPAINRCPELKLPNGRPDFDAIAHTMGCQNWYLPDHKTFNVMAHDLGLYEVFICAFLFLILYLIKRFWTSRRSGTMIVVAALYYAPIRFFLDFLRFPNTDPRYLGLTPAQHLCILTVIGGVLTIRAMAKKGADTSLFETDEARAALRVPGGLGSGSGGGDEGASKAKTKAKTKAKVVRKKRN